MVAAVNARHCARIVIDLMSQLQELQIQDDPGWIVVAPISPVLRPPVNPGPRLLAF